MSHQIWLNNSQKVGLQTTQVQGLVIDLAEQEQEMISGFGGRDDGWVTGWRVTVETQELQKLYVASNFRLETLDLPLS